MRKYGILALWVAVFALGLAACLTGAMLMAFGGGLLGESHTGIATIIGIVGIGLIGTSGTTLAAMSTKRSSKEAKSRAGGV